MPNKDFGVGHSRPQRDSDIVRDVHDALCRTRIELGRERRVQSGEPTLFELEDFLLRFEAIDEVKRAADALAPDHDDATPDVTAADCGGPAPLLHLSPARFEPLRELVTRAYAEVRDGCSADRVVADEVLNDEFLRRCWELGAMATAFELNWYHLNARKAGSLRVPGSTRRFVIPADRLNEFAFATEYSIRYIQNEHARLNGRIISLDRILCDPRLAAEFDDTAKRIAPGCTSLEYRWAAFTVRKARRPYKNPVTIGFDRVGETRSVLASRLPAVPGIYRFMSDGHELYVGETDNIRRQIGIHFDNNGTAVFPEWLSPGIRGRINLFVGLMRGAPSTAERSRAKTFFTDKWGPHFNWLGRRSMTAA